MLKRPTQLLFLVFARWKLLKCCVILQLKLKWTWTDSATSRTQKECWWMWTILTGKKHKTESYKFTTWLIVFHFSILSYSYPFSLITSNNLWFCDSCIFTIYWTDFLKQSFLEKKLSPFFPAVLLVTVKLLKLILQDFTHHLHRNEANEGAVI